MSLRDLQGKGIWIPLQLPSLLVPSDKPTCCVTGNTVLAGAQSPYCDTHLTPHCAYLTQHLLHTESLSSAIVFFCTKGLLSIGAQFCLLDKFPSSLSTGPALLISRLLCEVCHPHSACEVMRLEGMSNTAKAKGEVNTSRICFRPRLLMLFVFFSKCSVRSCGLLVWDFGRFGRFLEW